MKNVLISDWINISMHALNNHHAVSQTVLKIMIKSQMTINIDKKHAIKYRLLISIIASSRCAIGIHLKYRYRQ